ncbi:MAG: polar amino acid transport system substrate-binding protein [Mycobacteriales bacterium]|jgi:polar amino acid transport system substrate-binding protein
MTPHRRIIGYAALLAAAALLATACSANSGSGDVLASMRKAGFARVPLAQTPPFATISAGGVPSGYLVDVTGQVLKQLGVGQLKATATTYDAMIPALQAGQYDLLPGGLNITEARCKVILFSQPLSVQHEALGLPVGNPKKLTDYKSVAADPALRLAVFSGSSQQSFALSQGVRQSQLVAVPDSQTGITAVTSGRADAFAAGQFTLQAQKDKNSPIDIVVDNASKLSGVGIGFRTDDRAARDEFDKVLSRLRQDGTLATLYARNGFTNGDLLRTATRADIAPSCT